MVAAKTEVKSWKRSLIECRSLMGQAGESAYHRVQKLLVVFNDGEFRADNGLLDDFEAGEHLDEFTQDLALTFIELRALLDHFPKIDRWKTGKLKMMQAEMLAASKQRQNEERQPHTVNRVTKANFEKVEQEAKTYKAALAKVEKERETDSIKIERLERENLELRQEVAHLKGQIAELRRERQAVGV